MPLANDLLEQAYHLANRERKRPRQASLRRAVSTAYYALFHLLISEATLNWRRVDQRPECNRFINRTPPPPLGPELDCVTHLHRVAVAFLYSQQQRHTADYDKATRWDRAEALALISQVESE